ncbi:MAG: hypothetical protein ABWK00_05590 [Desulfurococcaceae archaeon]
MKSPKGKYLLRKVLGDALEFYNRTRAPEAVAKLVEFDGERAVVEFSGTFCETCGVRDWVEDLAYIIKSMGYDAELVEYVEAGDDRRLGIFRLGAEDGGRRDR